MEVESHAPPSSNGAEHVSKVTRRTLVVIVNYIIMVFGSAASPLLLRLYFIHGGNRKWLSSCLVVAGFPVILLPLTLSYASRRRSDRILRQSPTKAYFMTPRVFFACILLGALTGLNSLLLAYGNAYLPVSTSSILGSTQLGFTAFFAWLMVKQRFTAFSVNAVTLLTFGAAILGMGAAKDRPEGDTKGQYYLGFFMALAAAALTGLILPLVELTYMKAKQVVTYTLVMEVQLVMAFFGTFLCTVGMIINKDFQAISREAREFGLGEGKYYIVLVSSAIVLQLLLLGTIGVIFFSSALLVGVVGAFLIPVNEVLAVIFFNESFGGVKGVSLALSLWGLTSYFYGEYKHNKKMAAEDANSRILNPQD